MDKFLPDNSSTDHLSFPKARHYYCPYCKELIMKGNVKKLTLLCPECNAFINADAEDLIGKPEHG